MCLALALAACDGDGGPDTSPSATASPSVSPSVAPSPPSVSPSTSPSESPSGTPAPEPDLQLPGDAPTELAEPLEPAAIEGTGYVDLLPPGATAAAVESFSEPFAQIAVSWYRGDDAFAHQTGLVVWQRFQTGPPWRAVYAFTNRASSGVFSVTLQGGDVTGDGIADILSREDTGGSGACATWRVVTPALGSASETYRRQACDTSIEISGGALSLREAVYEPDDPHCCPSAFRYVTLGWDGDAFVQTSSEIVDNPS